jgi:transposase InsO family protein
MSKPSFGGTRYFVIFKDNYSGFRVLYCIKKKSDIFEKFKKLQGIVLHETRNSIIKLRSDRGGEYLSGSFSQYLVDANIQHDVTAPYTPEQNRFAEREN